jgi:hypothetical protein
VSPTASRDTSPSIPAKTASSAIPSAPRPQEARVAPQAASKPAHVETLAKHIGGHDPATIMTALESSRLPLERKLLILSMVAISIF